MKLHFSKRKIPFKKLLHRGEDGLIDFWHRTRQEVKETREAEGIFVRYVEGKGISEEERVALKNQGIDLVKIIFIGVPLVVIPGFSVVMIVLVKLGHRFNFNVLPSAFASADNKK